MELQFRIDTNNFITVNAKLQAAQPGQSADGPEVVAAVIADEKLSNLSRDDLLDIAGQIVDHLTARIDNSPPQEDWRDLFRSGKLGK